MLHSSMHHQNCAKNKMKHNAKNKAPKMAFGVAAVAVRDQNAGDAVLRASFVCAREDEIRLALVLHGTDCKAKFVQIAEQTGFSKFSAVHRVDDIAPDYCVLFFLDPFLKLQAFKLARALRDMGVHVDSLLTIDQYFARQALLPTFAELLDAGIRAWFVFDQLVYVDTSFKTHPTRVTFHPSKRECRDVLKFCRVARVCKRLAELHAPDNLLRHVAEFHAAADFTECTAHSFHQCIRLWCILRGIPIAVENAWLLSLDQPFTQPGGVATNSAPAAAPARPSHCR